jgi:hypothetical protein
VRQTNPLVNEGFGCAVSSFINFLCTRTVPSLGLVSPPSRRLFRADLALGAGAGRPLHSRRYRLGEKETMPSGVMSIS